MQYICFGEDTVVAHWHDIHKGATVTTLPEIYDITDNSNSVDGGSTTTEKMDTVNGNAFMQPNMVEPISAREMSICPPPGQSMNSK